MHEAKRHSTVLPETVGLADAAALVDRDVAVPETARGIDGQRDERRLFLLHAQTRDVVRAGHLRNIELLAGGSAIEDVPGILVDDQLEVDAFRLHFPRIQGLHAVVEAARKRELHAYSPAAAISSAASRRDHFIDLAPSRSAA